MPRIPSKPQPPAAPVPGRPNLPTRAEDDEGPEPEPSEPSEHEIERAIEAADNANERRIDEHFAGPRRRTPPRRSAEPFMYQTGKGHWKEWDEPEDEGDF